MSRVDGHDRRLVAVIIGGIALILAGGLMAGIATERYHRASAKGVAGAE